MKKLALGICDNPQKQAQPIFKIDLLRNNIAVFGGSMSGKTTFIKTLLVRLHEVTDPQKEKENIYIIDFGGALSRYGALPNVCACFDNSNEENIRRIFKQIEKRLEKNSKQLQGQPFIECFNKESGYDDLPHITLIIENINSFLADERYTSYQEVLLKLCREGLSKGLSIVLTANDVAGGLNRFLTNFSQKIAFEMQEDKYFDIFNRKVVQPMKLPGRGVATLNSVPLEFQCFLPFADEYQELDSFIEEANARYDGYRPEKLIAFEQELTKENFSKYCATQETYEECTAGENKIVVGLDYYEHKPIAVNLQEMRLIAIYGKKQFGKSNLLSLLVKSIAEKHRDYRFVFLDDGRKQLAELHEWLPKDENNVYLTSVEQMRKYLCDEGYYNSYGVARKDFVEKENPFTVFILQNKSMFQQSSNVRILLEKDVPYLTSKAEEKGYLFILSDVRKTTDNAMAGPLNSNISTAFLLDNIGEFVADKGSKSVFGEMDAKELKMEYAKCEVGDGYYYDIESDELRKLKFIKM